MTIKIPNLLNESDKNIQGIIQQCIYQYPQYSWYRARKYTLPNNTTERYIVGFAKINKG